MNQENHQPGAIGFDVFSDFLREIFAKKDVAAEPKKHEFKRERQPIRVEVRTHLTDERVREIVSGQVEQLADFTESLLLDQREILERQHAAQLDQLSKIVALFGQMQGASHAEPANLDNLIITTVVLDAAGELDDQIYYLRGAVGENFNEQAAGLAYIMQEISDCKALLMESRTNQSSGRRRCKVNMRKRRFGSTAQGGDRG